MIKQNQKKGYLQIDFLFVLIIFLVFFFFVYTQYYDESQNYKEYNKLNKDLSDLKYLCDMLTLTQGQPKNWNDIDIINVDFFGLVSNNTFDLNQSKVNTFFNSSNYKSIYNKLDLNRAFGIKIKNSTHNLYAMGENKTDLSEVVRYSCPTYLNSNLVYLEVTQWD